VCRISPCQVENSGNLPHKVIVRHYLIKTERIEELLLTMVEPPHHRLPRRWDRSAGGRQAQTGARISVHQLFGSEGCMRASRQCFRTSESGH
jgi:hypothetical protein